MIPTNEATTAPTAANPKVASLRLSGVVGGELKNTIAAAAVKPTTNGKPKTSKSKSAHDKCDTILLR